MDGFGCDGVAEATISSLLGIIEGIPPASLRTGEHSENVATYADAVGRALGFDARRLERLRRIAVLHDIGKSQVPATILGKPGPLTAPERAAVERHPAAGADILCRAGLRDEAAVVRAHHERFDGTGYPEGIAAPDIPLEARIVFVVDSFESMTSDRPYRRGISVGEARAELRRCAGTQFDPMVVDAFDAILGRGLVSVRALRGGAVRGAAREPAGA